MEGAAGPDLGGMVGASGGALPNGTWVRCCNFRVAV
jgi:hypothetical protein